MSAGALGSGGELHPVTPGPAGDGLSRTHQPRSHALPGEVRADAQGQHAAQLAVAVQERHHVQADNTDNARANGGYKNSAAPCLSYSGQATLDHSCLGRVAQFTQQRCNRRTITASGIADRDLVRRTTEIRRRGMAATLLSRHGPLWTIGRGCQIGGECEARAGSPDFRTRLTADRHFG